MYACLTFFLSVYVDFYFDFLPVYVHLYVDLYFDFIPICICILVSWLSSCLCMYTYTWSSSLSTYDFPGGGGAFNSCVDQTQVNVMCHCITNWMSYVILSTHWMSYIISSTNWKKRPPACCSCVRRHYINMSYYHISYMLYLYVYGMIELHQPKNFFVCSWHDWTTSA